MFHIQLYAVQIWRTTQWCAQVWDGVTAPTGFGENSETVRLFIHNQTHMLIFNHNKVPDKLVT
jgi:hypothetical protein